MQTALFSGRPWDQKALGLEEVSSVRTVEGASKHEAAVAAAEAQDRVGMMRKALQHYEQRPLVMARISMSEEDEAISLYLPVSPRISLYLPVSP